MLLLSYIMHPMTLWRDYFTGNPTTTRNRYNGPKLTLSDASAYISNSLFDKCTSNDSGGALYCKLVPQLLIESTSFFSCKTSHMYGGAIYFTSLYDCECVLNKVCANNCCSSKNSHSYGQFAKIEIKGNISCKNYVVYSSIVRCINANESSYYPMRLDRGIISFPKVNISMNKNERCSGVYCCPSSDSSSITCSFSYSTFIDNNATSNTCISIPGGANFEIKFCNIIRNTQIRSYEGTISISGDLMIKDSCILENKADKIFSIGSGDYTITLSRCTIDSTINDRRVVINNTVTKSFVLALDHISTRNCHAQYDSTKKPTPTTQPPFSSKKRMYYCTCGGFFYLSRLRDFFS
jgi:hypothetical protein